MKPHFRLHDRALLSAAESVQSDTPVSDRRHCGLARRWARELSAAALGGLRFEAEVTAPLWRAGDREGLPCTLRVALPEGPGARPWAGATVELASPGSLGAAGAKLVTGSELFNLRICANLRRSALALGLFAAL